MKKILVLLTLLIATAVSAQWYDFIGNLQLDSNAPTPAQSEAMIWYNGTDNKVAFYDDTKAQNVATEEDAANTLHAAQSTGIIDGCNINVSSIGTANAELDACTYRIVDNYTDPLNPEVTVMTMTATSIPVPNIATQDISTLTVDKTGTFSFTAQSAPSSVDLRDNIVLGSVIHFNRTSIQLIQNDNFGLPIDAGMAFADHDRVFGKVNYEGNVFSGVGATLALDKTVGTIFGFGINYKADKKSQNFKPIPACTGCSWTYTYRDGSGGWTNVPSSTLLVPGSYDDGDGTLGSVNPSQYTVVRIYLAGQILAFQYGQQIYTTLAGAENAVVTGTDAIEINPSIDQTTLLGWIILKGNDTTVPQSQIFTARPNSLGAGNSSVTVNAFSALPVNSTGNPNLITTCNNIILADASTASVVVTFPDSTAGNTDCTNQIYLYENSNPVTVTTQGGTQLIGDTVTQELSITDTGLTVFSYPTGNKYLITQDSRPDTTGINIDEHQRFRVAASSGFTSGSAGIYRWGSTLVETGDANIFEYDDSTGRFTATRDVEDVQINTSIHTTASGVTYILYNTTAPAVAADIIGRSANKTGYHPVSAGGDFKKDDYFVIYGNAALSPNTQSVTITAEAKSPRVVTTDDAPTNSFTAIIQNNGTATIISSNTGWIESADVTRTALGTVSIDISGLGLTQIPEVNVVATEATAGAGNNAVIQSITTSTIVVRTYNSATPAFIDTNFHIELNRQGDDYVNFSQTLLKQQTIRSTDEKVVGTWTDGSTLYEKTFTWANVSSGTVLDASFTLANVTMRDGWVDSTSPTNSNQVKTLWYIGTSNYVYLQTFTNGLTVQYAGTYDCGDVTVQYTKN